MFIYFSEGTNAILKLKVSRKARALVQSNKQKTVTFIWNRYLCWIHSSMALKETQAHFLWQEMHHGEEPTVLPWLLVLPNCFHILILPQERLRQANVKDLNIIASTIYLIGNNILPRSGLVIVTWRWLDSEETVELWVELDLMDLTDAMKGNIFGGLGLCLGTTVAVWLHSENNHKVSACAFHDD